MQLESKEKIFILRGDCPFKEGASIKWISWVCDSKAGLVRFITNRDTFIHSVNEIFCEYKVKNEFSEDQMIVENQLPIGKIFKPMAFEMVKN